MNLRDAEELAKRTMIKYSLYDWNFCFNNRKTSLGLCSGRRKTIYLSKPFVLLNEIEIIHDTILHEVAHALVGVREGHNYVWKRKALEIGCSAERVCSKSDVLLPEGKFVYVCPNCGKDVNYYRRPKRDVACRDCCVKYNRGKYSEEFKFIKK